MTLGKKIADARREKGWSQEALAEKLNVSPQAVSKWETAASCPDISLLPQLAKLFGTTVDALLCEEDAPAPVVQQLPPESRRPVEQLTLRIKVESADGDHVRVNLPMALVKAALEIGIQLPGMDGNKALKSIDFEKVLAMAEQGLLGKLVELDSADGDHVEICVE